MRFLVLASLVLLSIEVQEADAQRPGFYRHRSKTCNQFSVRKYPGKYPIKYQEKYHYSTRTQTTRRAMVVAKADPIAPAKFGDSILVNEIRFHVPVTAIKTDRVSLDRIGLAVFSTGEAMCTGILNCNGGVDGGLSGSNVVIHVRAFAGVPETDFVADSLMVWEERHETYVYKNRPTAITVKSSGKQQSDQLKRFFPKITHMEIEVEHIINR